MGWGKGVGKGGGFLFVGVGAWGFNVGRYGFRSLRVIFGFFFSFSSLEILFTGFLSCLEAWMGFLLWFEQKIWWEVGKYLE